MIKNADEPAYPVECAYSGDVIRGQQTGSFSGWATGLTKREHFIAAIAQGFAANTHVYEEWGMDRQVAEAMRLADAYLDAIAKATTEHGRPSGTDAA